MTFKAKNGIDVNAGKFGVTKDGDVTARQVNQIVNVKAFGAKGDSVSDDSDAIALASEYCKTNGGVLFFPKGDYYHPTYKIPDTIAQIYETGEFIQSSRAFFRVGTKRPVTNVKDGTIYYDETEKELMVRANGIWTRYLKTSGGTITGDLEIKGKLTIDGQAISSKPIDVIGVSVKDFGAKGDGVTDDTRALVNAFQTVANTGGTVLIPDGVYKISDIVDPVVTFATNTKLFIQGSGKSIIKPSEKQMSLHFQGFQHWITGVKLGHVVIEGLVIDGTDAGVHFDDVDCGMAIRCQGLQSAMIRDNIIKDFYGQGIQIEGVNKAVVEANQLINVWGLNPTQDPNGFDNYGDGIYVSYCVSPVVRDNVIHNDISNARPAQGRAGIVLEFDSWGGLVAGNKIRGYDRGIHVEATKGKHVIENNYVEGCFAGIVYTYDWGDSSIIRDNTITNVGVPRDTKHKRIMPYGALLHVNTPNIIVRGNRLRTEKEYLFTDLLVVDVESKNCLIEENYFECTGTTDTERSDILFTPYSKGFTFRNNTTRNIYCITIGFGSGIIEGCDIEAEMLEFYNSQKPGLSLIKNKFSNSGKIMKGHPLGWNAYGDIIDNEFYNMQDGVVYDDGDTFYGSGGNVSGNILYRTIAEGSDIIFQSNTSGKRHYYTKKPNYVVDVIRFGTLELAKEKSFENPIYGIGEPYLLEDGTRVVLINNDTTEVASTYWRIGDKMLYLHPDGVANLGWIRTIPGRSTGVGEGWTKYGLGSGGAVVLKSPGNTDYKLGVTENGSLTTEKL